MGQLPVLPKHYWEGTDASGKPSATSARRHSSRRSARDNTASKLSKPASRSPMSASRIIGATTCRSISAQNNFDEIEFIYFRDRGIIFEAFKADQLDVRTGPGTKEWDTQYDFPAVKNGNVVKDDLLHQGRRADAGLRLQYRRAKFADPRVRQAFNLAYDFEGRMRILSFGDYNKRTQSYFQNSELAATGLPQGLELEILNQFRGKIPDEVFTTEYKIR